MNTDIESSNPPSILFVDDERPILKALTRFGRSMGWQIFTAESGKEALKLAEHNVFDIICSDMRMPEMNGAELLAEFKVRWPLTIRLLLTGYSDISALESVINDAHVHNYLTKPWDENLLSGVIQSAMKFRESETERSRLEKVTQIQNVKLSKLALLLDKQVKERSMEVDQALQLLQGSHDRSNEALLDSVAVINRILEWKEGRAHGQSEFVTRYAVAIATHLKFSDTDTEAVRLASLMHRVGTLALPDEVRKKPFYALTREEQEIYRQYPLWGERSIKHSSHLGSIAKIVRHHREHINGNGFPDGLSLQEIPIAAQIIGLVSDFYEAYSGQISRDIYGIESAKVYINEWAGRKHDAGLVEALWLVLIDFNDIILESCVLTTKDLREKMELNEDIYSRNGTLLLAKETILTNVTIQKLIEHEAKYKEVFEVNIKIKKNNSLETA